MFMTYALTEIKEITAIYIYCIYIDILMALRGVRTVLIF